MKLNSMNKIIKHTQPIRGMKDIPPLQYDLFQRVVDSASKIARRYCFENFATPILEYSSVFDRTLGETSDVVNKEMYSFVDRSGQGVTLRPELTAGIMRAVLSEGLIQNLPLKFFSYGPLFRYDRPQAGRQRQFHQVNFEIIGEESYSVDVEAIKIGYDIVKDLAISDITIEINSLGCADSRVIYQQKLVEYFARYESELSEDSKLRLYKNPMRIFDSKDDRDKILASGAPRISAFYTKLASSRFEKILLMLNELSVPYQVNELLVRGLDYYCHTAFEYSTNAIGAQTAIGGGGRYDGLARIMGSKSDIPSIGLALGIERIMLLLKDQESYNKAHLGIFPISELEINASYLIASKLRDLDIPINLYEKGKLGKRIERAISKGCNYAAFLGENELIRNEFKLKNLITGEECMLSYDDLLKTIREQFAC